MSKALTLSFLCLLLGCHKPRHQEHLKTVNYQNFRNLNVSKYDSSVVIENFSIDRIAILDTFILTTDVRDTFNLKIYGLKSKKLLKSFIPRGNGKYDAVDISDLILTNSKSTFWIYDVTLSKFQKINISKALIEKNYQPEIIFKSVKAINTPTWITDNLFAGASYSIGDCRFLIFNDKSKIIQKIGTLPGEGDDWPIEGPDVKMNLSAMTYTIILKKQPDKDNYIALYNTIPRVEFYTKGGIMKKFSGPDNYAIDVSFHQQGADGYIPMFNEQTRYAYTGAFVTATHIYTLYSGTANPYSDKIVVYDWAGNPCTIYHLCKSISAFTIEETRNDTSILTFENGRFITMHLN